MYVYRIWLEGPMMRIYTFTHIFYYIDENSKFWALAEWNKIYHIFSCSHLQWVICILDLKFLRCNIVCPEIIWQEFQNFYRINAKHYHMTKENISHLDAHKLHNCIYVQLYTLYVHENEYIYVKIEKDASTYIMHINE